MNYNLRLSSHRKEEPEERVLYIVSTPIGNLEDISIRAINILKKVSLIACEDTRITGRLLNNYEISNKTISFHKFNYQEKIPYLISMLKNGASIALVSDAGTPLISDPGELLVSEIKRNDLDVIAIPGACAALSALVCSGLPTSKFSFYGFLPRKGKERRVYLESISNNIFSSIVYESPKRISKLLIDLKSYCKGDREISLSKELTKKYEQTIFTTIDETLNSLKNNEMKGEFTIIIRGIDERKEGNNDLEIKKDLLHLINAGLSHTAASNFLAKKLGKSKKYIYQLILNNEFNSGSN